VPQVSVNALQFNQSFIKPWWLPRPLHVTGLHQTAAAGAFTERGREASLRAPALLTSKNGRYLHRFLAAGHSSLSYLRIAHLDELKIDAVSCDFNRNSVPAW
jgi:hypothetical protein